MYTTIHCGILVPLALETSTIIPSTISSVDCIGILVVIRSTHKKFELSNFKIKPVPDHLKIESIKASIIAQNVLGQKRTKSGLFDA